MAFQEHEIERGGISLQAYLRTTFPRANFLQVKKAFRTGEIRLNAKRVKGQEEIQVGDRLRLPGWFHGSGEKIAPISLRPDQELEFEKAIIFEDQEILILNKPRNLAVQGGSKTPWHLDRLIEGLVQRGRFLEKNIPRLVHRLDRDTSGVLIMAKTAEAAAALANQFKGRTLEKSYIAIVYGVPEKREGKINFSLAKRGPKGQQKMVHEEEGLSAETRYRVLDAVGDILSVLELEPKTGRMHQLRVHCKMIGHPILGDPKYGEGRSLPEGMEKEEGLHLCARTLTFDHPKTGRRMTISAPLPPHMQKMIKTFHLEV